MRNRVLVLAASLIAGLAGCEPLGIAGATHLRTLDVAHFAVECPGTVQRCLLIREPGQVFFELRAGGIDGFTYDWGYLYDVDVTESGSGSSIHTVLKKQNSRTRVVPGTEFDVTLTGTAVTQASPGHYQFGFLPQFVCATGVDCAELVVKLNAGKKIHFRIAHPAVATDPLTLRAWDECLAGATGVYTCTN